VATFTDLRERIVPDEISLGGLGLGLLLSFFYPPLQGVDMPKTAFFHSCLGALIGSSILYITGVGGNIVFRRETMGGGDIKLLGMIGAFLGWQMALLTYFISPFLGAGVGIVEKIRRKAETIPYAPFLSAGAIISLIWGDKILEKVLYFIK